MQDSTIHIGDKISEVLAKQHKTKSELGKLIGLAKSASTYLTTRKSVDAETLWKISLALGHDFFQYYPVGGTRDEGRGTSEKKEVDDQVQMTGGDEELQKLKDELEKCRREVQLRGVEIQYLKKINELLERK